MLPNIRMLREEAGIGQRALAKAVGVSQQAIHRYESANAIPDPSVLKKMADYFDTSVDFIVGYTDYRGKAGSSGEYHLDAEEVELLTLFRQLPDKQKACIEMTIRAFAEK